MPREHWSEGRKTDGRLSSGKDLGSALGRASARKVSQAVLFGLEITDTDVHACLAGRPNIDTLLSLVPDFPIKTYLIDDGWQDVSSTRKLMSFHEWDGMKAPMSTVVPSLKDKGVQEVGVWLTLQGYWIAIDPSSPLIQKYDCRSYKSASREQPRGGVNVPLQAGEGERWLPSPEKAKQFWLDWFTEMRSWGVSFVKVHPFTMYGESRADSSQVDNQADYDMITGPGTLHIQQAMWSGMLGAVEEIWGSIDRVIMCMSHNERMLNGPGGLGAERPKGDLIFRSAPPIIAPRQVWAERHAGTRTTSI